MLTRPDTPGTSVAGGDVTITVADGIGTVRFGHPKGNSLPGALLTRLAEAITWIGKDPAARVVVLRSEGTGPFCAGASFDELVSIGDADAGEEFFSGFAGDPGDDPRPQVRARARPRADGGRRRRHRRGR
jgi:methylglutaconyl-CoA hydratase